MKHRSDKVFIEDILSAMEKIRRYTFDLSYRDFIKNDMIIDATLRNFEIIGEASRNVSKDTKDKYPDIPWKRMIGLRNIVSHDYFGVDLKIIWTILSDNLPGTEPYVKRVLQELT